MKKAWQTDIYHFKIFFGKHFVKVRICGDAVHIVRMSRTEIYLLNLCELLGINIAYRYELYRSSFLFENLISALVRFGDTAKSNHSNSYFSHFEPLIFLIFL